MDNSSKYTKKWKKFLAIVLSFALVLSGFAIGAPERAEASGSSSPGGVEGMALWLNASDEVIVDGNGNVTQWTDLTTGKVFSTTSTVTSVTYNQSGANFNPAVVFNGSGKMIGDASTNINVKEIFTVANNGTSGAGAVFAITPTTANRQGFFRGPNVQFITSAGGGSVGPDRTLSSANTESGDLLRFLSASSPKARAWENGVAGPERGSFINDTSPYELKLGAVNDDTSFLNGRIAELIVFDENKVLTIDEMNRLNSYMSFKYGITLKDASGNPTDYIASDGTSTMWTAAANTGYGNRITGIGRDDSGALYQKQSKSADTNANVTIALGDTIQVANSQNTQTIANDKSFFVFSDNAGNTGFNTIIPKTGENLKRMDRFYKVEKTNWQDRSITLKADGVEDGPAYLVVSGTGSFDSEADLTYYPLTNRQVTLNSDALGPYFTFAAPYPVLQGAELTSAQSNNANLTLTFDREVSLADLTDVTVKVGAATIDLTSVTHTVYGKSISIPLTEGDLASGGEVKVSYDATTGKLKDAKNNLPAMSFTDQIAANKIALQVKVSEINGENLQAANYSTESWNSLQNALTDAQNVLDNPSASQAEVNAALTTLEAARAGLTVDKAPLQAKVSEINGENLQEKSYSTESWDALQNALSAAQNVLDNPNANQAQINEALTALNAAKQALVKLAEDDQLVQLAVTGHTADGNTVINLTPAFSPDVYSTYKATVSNSTYSLSIAPIAASANTDVKITLNGTPVDSADWNSLPLVEGRNVIKTGVYSKDGTLLNEYEVEIIRTTNKLSDLKPTAGSLSPAFDPNTTEYSLSVSSTANAIQWTPTALDPNAKIELSVNGGAWQLTASGGLSPELPLNTGMNAIVVRVTDANGQVKMYTINVMRSNSDTGTGTGTAVNPTPTTAPESGVITTVNNTDSSFATGTTASNVTTVAIDKDKLSDILSNGNGQELNVSVPGDGSIKVEGLTAATLKQLSDTGSTLNIENLLAIYPIPSNQLDLGAITEQWSGAPLGEVAVDIDIKGSSDSLKAAAQDQASKGGYDLLINPVDLSLSFTYKGQSVKPDQLTGYAPRYIALPEGIDPNKITTGVIINPDGTVFHVPTVVTQINSRYFALINDLRSQGSYSVIWNPQNFDDVKSHWAQESVNNITARLQLAGTGNNTFSPNSNIVRSEFATIVASGLGLMRQGLTGTPYSDIEPSSWYHDAVTIASEFGIIKGFKDGTFHGNALITREQGIAMIARSLHVVQPQKALSESEINQILAPYGDMDEISGYARESVAQLIKAGILQGTNGQQLKPKAEMTRAETVALIERLLKDTKLID